MFSRVISNISCPDPDPDGKGKMSHPTFVGPEVVYNPQKFGGDWWGIDGEDRIFVSEAV